jgi:integrase
MDWIHLGLIPCKKKYTGPSLFSPGRGNPCAGDKLIHRPPRPLTVPSVIRLVKAWCKAINLQGNFGSHTLRKTWGYHQRVTFGTDIPRLMICFNHSSQRQTLDYLCVQPEEIKDVYENELWLTDTCKTNITGVPSPIYIGPDFPFTFIGLLGVVW